MFFVKEGVTTLSGWWRPLFFVLMVIPLPVIWLLIYLAGYWLSFIMLRAEQEAEGEVYTRGGRALALAMSTVSWLMVTIMLVRAWIGQVGVTGYWTRPINEAPAPTKIELINDKDIITPNGQPSKTIQQYHNPQGAFSREPGEG